MEQLNKTPTTGKFGDVAKVLDTNFGLIVTKLMELSKAKKMNCGFYSSETELKTAYPNPDKGMMAYVGSGTDYTIYRCKTDGTWTATSETFKVNTSVDLSTYATKDALKQVKGSVDSLLLGAVYGGIAARITNPGTPKTKVFYLPTEVGEYPNFGNLSVVENEIAFLYYDGTNWTKQSVDFSNNFNDINNKLSGLADKAKELEGNIEAKADTATVNAALANVRNTISTEVQERKEAIAAEAKAREAADASEAQERKEGLAKKADVADVDSKFTEEAARVDAELDKKANAKDVEQSFSEQTAKNTEQDAEIAKKANAEDVNNSIQELDKKLNRNLLAIEFDDETGDLNAIIGQDSTISSVSTDEDGNVIIEQNII